MPATVAHQSLIPPFMTLSRPNSTDRSRATTPTPTTARSSRIPSTSTEATGSRSRPSVSMQGDQTSAEDDQVPCPLCQTVMAVSEVPAHVDRGCTRLSDLDEFDGIQELSEADFTAVELARSTKKRSPANAASRVGSRTPQRAGSSAAQSSSWTAHPIDLSTALSSPLAPPLSVTSKSKTKIVLSSSDEDEGDVSNKSDSLGMFSKPKTTPKTNFTVKSKSDTASKSAAKPKSTSRARIRTTPAKRAAAEASAQSSTRRRLSNVILTSDDDEGTSSPLKARRIPSRALSSSPSPSRSASIARPRLDKGKGKAVRVPDSEDDEIQFADMDKQSGVATASASTATAAASSSAHASSRLVDDGIDLEDFDDDDFDGGIDWEAVPDLASNAASGARAANGTSVANGTLSIAADLFPENDDEDLTSYGLSRPRDRQRANGRTNRSHGVVVQAFSDLTLLSDMPEGLADFYRNHWRRRNNGSDEEDEDYFGVGAGGRPTSRGGAGGGGGGGSRPGGGVRRGGASGGTAAFQVPMPTSEAKRGAAAAKRGSWGKAARGGRRVSRGRTRR